MVKRPPFRRCRLGLFWGAPNPFSGGVLSLRAGLLFGISAKFSTTRRLDPIRGIHLAKRPWSCETVALATKAALFGDPKPGHLR